MSKIPKNKVEQEIPKIIELTEQEAKERAKFYRNDLKDEKGLIESIEKFLKKRTVKKDEFKKT